MKNIIIKALDKLQNVEYQAGVRVVAVEDNPTRHSACDHCILNKTGKCHVVECHKCEREDGRSVHFKRPIL